MVIVMSIVLQAHGSKLAGGCSNGVVIIWEEDGKKCMDSKGHLSTISCVKWNKNEATHLLMTGSLDGVSERNTETIEQLIVVSGCRILEHYHRIGSQKVCPAH